jgi:hypothetical protein
MTNTDDLDLARLLPERDLPSDRRQQIQELLMNQIHHAAPAPRRGRRLVLATAAGAALVAGAVAAVAVVAPANLGANPDPRSSSVGSSNIGSSNVELTRVARTIELAAAYAAAQPFTPPRPDQWIYIQTRNLVPSAIAADKGQNSDSTLRLWMRADGTKMAGYNPETGLLNVWDQDNDYPALSTLPTDPAALLALLRAQLGVIPSGDPMPPRPALPANEEEWSVALFGRIAHILDGNLLPPDVTAALWRAAALIPGVTEASETVDGRTLTAVGRIQEGWRFEQLLLDPDTHEYVGYRSVAVQDHTYTTGPNGPVTERAGQVQWAATRLAAAIVDAPGAAS